MSSYNSANPHDMGRFLARMMGGGDDVDVEVIYDDDPPDPTVGAGKVDDDPPDQMKMNRVRTLIHQPKGPDVYTWEFNGYGLLLSFSIESIDGLRVRCLEGSGASASSGRHRPVVLDVAPPVSAPERGQSIALSGRGCAGRETVREDTDRIIDRAAKAIMSKPAYGMFRLAYLLANFDARELWDDIKAHRRDPGRTINETSVLNAMGRIAERYRDLDNP